MAGRHFVVGFHPEGKKKTINALEPGQRLTIGRRPGNHIVIDNSLNPESGSVSAQHATIHESGGKVIFQDHSTNGTTIKVEDYSPNRTVIAGAQTKTELKNGQAAFGKDTIADIQGSNFRVFTPEEMFSSMLDIAGLHEPTSPLEKTKFYDRLFHEFSAYSEKHGLRTVKTTTHPFEKDELGRPLVYNSSEGTPEYGFLNSLIKGKYYRNVENSVSGEMDKLREHFNQMREHRAVLNSWRSGAPVSIPVTKIENEALANKGELFKMISQHANLHEGQAKTMLESGAGIDFTAAITHLREIAKQMKS